MTITIGSFSSNRLLAQPFGYDELETEQGLTARKWRVSGLLTAAEWQSLLFVYDTWRDTRLTDEDTLSSGVVGTTVPFTGNANGIVWSEIDCWFITAPTADQAGGYLQATFEIVDATQKLEILLRQQEKAKERSEAELPDLGTVTLGAATLTLLAPMETYQDTPQLQLTASGNHVISGSLSATRLRRIQGTTNSVGWTNVRSWYESAVSSIPTAGTWFPLTGPTATAKVVIDEGVKDTEYTVSVDVAEIK